MTRRARSLPGALGIAVALTLLVPDSAGARRSDAHAYRFEQVWSTAIRLLRVDYGFPVRDRDRDIGFLLFDYTDRGRSHPGSLELVPFEADNGQAQIRVTLSIPAMPAYVERMVLDKLTRKLREDHGEPLRPPRARPAPAADDEESDEDEDEDEDEDAEEVETDD